MEKIYPRDIIAIVSLIACFILIALGINHIVSGITIMIITYYFSKRVYEEKHPNGDIEKRVKELEKPKTMTAHFNDVPKKIELPPNTSKEPLTTGDSKPLPVIKQSSKEIPHLPKLP